MSAENLLAPLTPKDNLVCILIEMGCTEAQGFQVEAAYSNCMFVFCSEVRPQNGQGWGSMPCREDTVIAKVQRVYVPHYFGNLPTLCHPAPHAPRPPSTHLLSLYGIPLSVSERGRYLTLTWRYKDHHAMGMILWKIFDGPPLPPLEDPRSGASGSALRYAVGQPRWNE